jgi:hypothetical protein
MVTCYLKLLQGLQRATFGFQQFQSVGERIAENTNRLL